MPRMLSVALLLLPASVATCGREGSPDDAAEAGDVATDNGAEADDGAGDETSAVLCNGLPQLCARRYDQVAYAATHNAMSNVDEGWIAPNQTHGIMRQLEDGIRALMLDTHDDGGATMLCHGYCDFGGKPLAEGLGEIAGFLDANPREVVTIIFESYVTAEATATAFDEAGLTDLLFVPPAAGDWPTLAEMIDAGTRLVVFTDSGGGAFPWYLDVWTWAWETDFEAQAPRDFSCDRNRGADGNLLFIFNHFLTDPVALPSLAEQVNYDPLNFVTVDFYDIGDLFPAVDALNAP